jgi:uracil-DNA glycosylase
MAFAGNVATMPHDHREGTLSRSTHCSFMTNQPPITSLKALREAEAACTRCPLYKDATQVVPGEGPSRARVMFVGEQPGDQEDRAGRPFVGPAGRILDQAIADAGLARETIFVTNAVKHFKFEQRGKRRLHKRPNAHEIERCRWWNDTEKKLVKPRIVVALGATAARSLMGKIITISKVRGEILDAPDGYHVVVTIHPSWLLRMDDAAQKDAEYKRLVADLRTCTRYLRDEAA